MSGTRPPQKIGGNHPKIEKRRTLKVPKNISINQPNPTTTKTQYRESKSPYGSNWKGTKVRRIITR